MRLRQEIIIDPIDSSLVYVPEGPFIMGTAPDGVRKTDHEEPQREVTLDPFYIGKFPVTNAQYAQFLEAAEHPPPRFYDNPRFNEPNCPVVGVSWYDAQAFLNWLNELTDESYRLPTEAEWEKTARGTDGRMYPWGNEWDVSKGNFGESRLKHTTPVGSYPEGVSPYGCYDMGGNVYEWCSDWSHPETYKYSPAHNPQGPIDGRRKVIRGGSWLPRGQFAARCANRAGYEPVQAVHNVGFRIAKSAE
ncbi:formylglycine-generating enzyme family protein [Candidatus Poribacteria bacterium]|nr:formylglycine-generating enzyme family protein [Candidatus Poribacteria bacterium]